MQSNGNSSKGLKITAALTGLAGAMSVGHWPRYAVPLEMTFYSAMVLAPLLLGVWKHRQSAGFWVGIGFAVLLHCAALYAIRPYFPFRTVLLIVPIALTEGTILAIVMLKSLGY